MLSQRNAVLLMLLTSFFAGCAASESQLNAFRQISTEDPGPWPVKKLSAGFCKHHYSMGQYQSSPLGQAVRPVQKPEDGILLIQGEEVVAKQVFELERADGTVAVIEKALKKPGESVNFAGFNLSVPDETPLIGTIAIQDRQLADFSFFLGGHSWNLHADGTLTVGTLPIKVSVRADNRSAGDVFFSDETYVDFTEGERLVAYLRLLPERNLWIYDNVPQDKRFAIAAVAVCILDSLELPDQHEKARRMQSITGSLSRLQ